MQALTHLTSLRAVVVGFNLSAILMLCLFDGSSVGVAGFLIRVRVSVPLLETVAQAFISVLMFSVIHGFWLGYVRSDTVGTMSSMHLLMKPVTEAVYSSMPESFVRVSVCGVQVV